MFASVCAGFATEPLPEGYPDDPLSTEPVPELLPVPLEATDDPDDGTESYPEADWKGSLAGT